MFLLVFFRFVEVFENTINNVPAIRRIIIGSLAVMCKPRNNSISSSLKEKPNIKNSKHANTITNQPLSFGDLKVKE